MIRTPASLAELTKAAAGDGVIFAGAVGGGYVFPEFLPAYDAVASLCKLLELLAPVERPLSELVAELPGEHARPPAAAVPLVAEGHGDARADRAPARPDVDLLDGIKVFDERGWAQLLPDPDEPLVHIYAEGATEEASIELEAELRGLVEEIMESEGAAAAAGASS